MKLNMYIQYIGMPSNFVYRLLIIDNRYLSVYSPFVTAFEIEAAFQSGPQALCPPDGANRHRRPTALSTSVRLGARNGRKTETASHPAGLAQL